MNLVERGRVGAERLAIARMVVGLTAFLFPRAFGRLWIAETGSSRRVAMVTRAFAVRDFALGLGAYRALKDGSPVRGWVEMGLLSDVTDSASALTGPPPMARRIVLAFTALIGAAGGVLALDGIDDPVVATDES